MKLWEWIKKCPILFLLLIGWMGLAAFTWMEGKLPLALEKNIIQDPVFTALIEKGSELPGTSGLDDPDISGLIPEEDGQDGGSVPEEDGQDGGSVPEEDGQDGTSVPDREGDADGRPVSGDGREDGPKGDGQPEQNDKSGDTSAEEGAGVTKFKKYKKKKTDSPYYTDPGKKALTTDYAYETVGKDYFDDALFIGDSRTVGMQDYSGLDNAQFFAKTGLNIYELLDDKFVTDPDDGKEVTVSYMLKKYEYKKIYLMIGINELGTGNTGTFQKAYERVIEKFRKWQPDAVIYIQGILPVSKAKASNDAVFNNININDKNVAIAQLADGKDVFYLDVSEKLTDKNGYLKKDYTFDEVHMYAQYYVLWTDYLMEHAVVR